VTQIAVMGGIMPSLCIMISGIALLGCSDAAVYTLYRNSPLMENTRLHVATFDSADSEQYNSETCLVARDLFQRQPGVSVRFWCEKGRFRK
jgi:hypothetical protein